MTLPNTRRRRRHSKAGRAETLVVNTTYAECDKYFMFYPPAKDYVKLEKMDDRNFHRNEYHPKAFCAEGSEPGWVAPPSAH